MQLYDPNLRGAECAYTNCTMSGFAHSLETCDCPSFVVTLPVSVWERPASPECAQWDMVYKYWSKYVTSFK